MTMSTPDEPSRVKPRRTSVDAAKKYWWVGVIAVPIVVALIELVPALFGGSSGNTYITNTRVGGDLYFITDVEFTDPARRATFDQAVTLARNGQYAEAKVLFDQLALGGKSAGVLNNLGVVNASLGDDTAAQQNLSQALQIEPANEAAKNNLGLVAKAIATQTANNTILTAAPYQLGASLDSNIGANGDADFFTFTGPAQRDLLRVRIDNKSTTLKPDVKVFDADRAQITSASLYQSTGGANLSIDFAAQPGAKYYVRVAGFSESAGAYSLSITPRQAFDRFEPNENGGEAREIMVGQDVEANIMDEHDVDVYKVTVPASPLRVTMTNRSATLIPELTVLNNNRSLAEKDYTTTAGAHLSVQVTPGAPGTWYVRVAAFNPSAGEYTIKVSP